MALELEVNTIDLTTFVGDDCDLYVNSISELCLAPASFRSAASSFTFTPSEEVILGKYSLKEDDNKFFFHYIAGLVRYL